MFTKILSRKYYPYPFAEEETNRVEVAGLYMWKPLTFKITRRVQKRFSSHINDNCLRRYKC
jgi:hypothetical protein